MEKGKPFCSLNQNFDYFRYFYWPKSKYCCYCRAGGAAMGILHPNWMSDKCVDWKNDKCKFNGVTEDQKRWKFFRQMNPNDDLINIEVEIDRPYIYSTMWLQGPSGQFSSKDEFNVESYTNTFPNSVFDLPSGDDVNGSCYIQCPASSICGP